MRFHVSSFGFGVLTGAAVLLAVAGGMRLASDGQIAGNDRQQWQGNGQGPDMARMAERFGMTEAKLRSELDGGKTMQDIAREKGVEFPGGRQGGQKKKDGGASQVSSGSGASSLSSVSSAASSAP